MMSFTGFERLVLTRMPQIPATGMFNTVRKANASQWQILVSETGLTVHSFCLEVVKQLITPWWFASFWHTLK